MNFKPTSLFAAMAGAALLSISPAATAVTYDWNSGTFVPDATAPNPLGALDVLNIGTAAVKVFDNVTFTNGGTVNWLASSGGLAFAQGASVVNNGLWDAQGDADLYYSWGAPASFVNNGTLRKSGGSGLTRTLGNIGLVNSGVIDVQTGTLQLSGYGTNTFNAGTSFIGAGVTELQASATFNGAFNSTNLRVAGGAGGISTGNAAVINGSVVFQSGTLKGDWTVASGQQLVLAEAGNKVLDGSPQVLTNNGTVNWRAGSGSLQLRNGAGVVNNGLWDAQGDADLFYGGGAATSFVNNGTLRKSGGSGTTGFVGDLSLANNGTIDVRTGNITLPAAFVNAGTLTGDGRFTTPGGLTNDGTVAPGSFGVGTLSMTGNFTQSGTGILALDLTSTASFDLLAITGAADLDGSLALNCLGACSFAVGDLFTVLTSSAARTGTFSGGLTLNGFATGAFDVLYYSNSVQLLVTQTVSAVPEPESYVLALAGLLLTMGAVRRRQRAR